MKYREIMQKLRAQLTTALLAEDITLETQKSDMDNTILTHGCICT